MLLHSCRTHVRQCMTWKSDPLKQGWAWSSFAISLCSIMLDSSSACILQHALQPGMDSTSTSQHSSGREIIWRSVEVCHDTPCLLNQECTSCRIPRSQLWLPVCIKPAIESCISIGALKCMASLPNRTAWPLLKPLQ